MSSSLRILFTAAVAGAILTLVGCPGFPGMGAGLVFTVDETAYGYRESIDLGEIEVGADPVTRVGTVTNSSGAGLTLAGAVVTGDFSVVPPELPVELDPGASIDLNLTFEPGGLGESQGTLELSLDGATLPFELYLTGRCVADAADLLVVTAASVEYPSGSSYDFGFRDATEAATQTSFALENRSEVVVTVTSVSVGAFGLSIDLPETPFEIAPGSETVGTLTFAPTRRGAVGAQLQVGVGHATNPFMMEVTGYGAYPPVAERFLVVSGAGTAAANGVYLRTEETSLDRPVFRQENGDHVIYAYHEIEFDFWAIDDDLDPTTTLYESYAFWYSGQTSDSWFVRSGDVPGPASAGEIVTTPARFAALYDNDILRVNYRYSNQGEDDEGRTLCQWYMSDDLGFSAVSGTYSPIAGETSETYQVVHATDHQRFFKVLVTPVAGNGTLIGEPVWYGPSGGVALAYGE